MRTLQPLLVRGPDALASRPPSDETFLLGDTNAGVAVRAITPVIGGGVESFVPDSLDVIRVPSIRGAVRWWWRALQPGRSTDDLRKEERRVWGGVGRDRNEQSASLVRIDVRVTKKGAEVPAGVHRRRPDGHLKALPDWDGGSELGYGLFPLQREEKDRKAWSSPGPMPTKTWRQGLEFELRVQVRSRGADSLAEKDRELVLDATRLWLTFGGYGARTRRGFGALHTDAVRFEDVLKTLEGVEGAARPERPTLAQRLVLLGNPCATPEEAHRALLRALQDFRQSTRFGRFPGASKPYGRSRWPEADSLRVVSRGRFREHPPARSFKAPSAPRAAFGMPIVVQFMGRDDAAAKGMIAATKEGGRWASPVLLRPVRRGDDYVPVVLILQSHHPSRAVIACDNGRSQENVSVTYDDAKHGGAHGVVRDALMTADGSALEAFATWLTTERGFHRHGGAR